MIVAEPVVVLLAAAGKRRLMMWLRRKRRRVEGLRHHDVWLGEQQEGRLQVQHWACQVHF